MPVKRIDCDHGQLRRQCPICERDDRIAELEASVAVQDTIIAGLKRERDELKALAMHETDVARAEVQARAAQFAQHKLMRQTLQAIGETVLCPGNWHPTEPVACRGMVAAVRELERERDQERAWREELLSTTVPSLERRVRERDQRITELVRERDEA